ncbi:unnamed protein product [Vicia faba]|uniref:Uncharacterized protein n=1 Tax=Vicia faba TaxID=3906 RepID=A0AAV1BAC0_VICFA|nr:unnamed protein product [Vicia faba]
MKFTGNGRKFVLRGSKTPSFKIINNQTLTHAIHKGAKLCFLSTTADSYSLNVPTCYTLPSNQTDPLPSSIFLLIDEYVDMFLEESTLPPIRPGFDHKISFREGSQPFNLRPYRFSVVHKDVIDRIVRDMLDHGIVQHSTSSFSSPTILVCKKDGSCRLCVDFRRLNDLTIKDFRRLITFVKNCGICQRNEPDLAAYPGLLLITTSTDS